VSRRWWFYYWKVYGAKDAFELVFFDRQPVSVRVPGSRVNPDFLAEESDFARQFGIEMLSCRSALLTLKSFAWEDKARFLAFTRDAFARVRDAGVQTLIIDVRANGGGDDDFWTEGVLPYIATKPYRWGSTYRKRVLEEYLDEGETSGEIVSGAIDRCIQPEPENPLHFSGKVYLLIGRSTYSSAILLSNVIQDFGFGIVAGTGGSARANQSGGVQRIVLPNTGLVVYWPRFILARPSAARDPLYVKPDIEVAENLLNPREAVDTLLARASTGCTEAKATSSN
jgi:C-terminal processing protease CtpA/Prc